MTSLYMDLRKLIFVTTLIITVKDIEKWLVTAMTVSCFVIIMVENVTVFDVYISQEKYIEYIHFFYDVNEILYYNYNSKYSTHFVLCIF